MPPVNPLLAQGPLPLFDQIRPEHVRPAISQLLQDASDSLETVTAADFPADWGKISAVHDAALDRLWFAWLAVWHLDSVAETPELRSAYGKARTEVMAFWARRCADERLYAKYKAIEPATLTHEQVRAREIALCEFVLGGAELKGDTRKRFADIQQRKVVLGQKFNENVRDATNAWVQYLARDELAGLPQDVLAASAAAAQAEGRTGHKVTLRTPLFSADDRALRERFYRAHDTCATRLSDHPEFDNTPIVAEILELRQEEARLLGYASYAELSLVPKMADSPEQVMRFVRELAVRTRPYAEMSSAVLRAFAAERFGIEDPAPWDWYYLIEKLRVTRHDFSSEELKQYFPVTKVVAGMLALVESAFEVTVRRTAAPLWHADAECYRLERGDTLLGHLYLDLGARDGKRTGAWAYAMRPRWLRPDSGAIQTPVVQLVCSFGEAGASSSSALLTHHEVTLLFHELGHALHHLLTQVDERQVAGNNGVEWDAIELPSQFMENFCWEWDVLRSISAHVDTGAALPRALFERVRAARSLMRFWGVEQRQIEFALFDMRLHAEPGRTVSAVLEEVRREVAVIDPPPHTQRPNTSFHLFSGGQYEAGFYSYNWAEVLSADAFAALEEAGGIMDVQLARRFRHAILESGGSRHALESFKAFRGRAPTMDAWLRHQGITSGQSSGGPE